MTKENRLLKITIVLSLPKLAAHVYMDTSRESKPDFSGRPGHGTAELTVHNNIIVLRRSASVT